MFDPKASILKLLTRAEAVCQSCRWNVLPLDQRDPSRASILVNSRPTFESSNRRADDARVNGNALSCPNGKSATRSQGSGGLSAW